MYGIVHEASGSTLSTIGLLWGSVGKAVGDDTGPYRWISKDSQGYYKKSEVRPKMVGRGTHIHKRQLLLLKSLHSPKLTWKWRRGPYKTTILYIGPSMSFHVNLGEGTSMELL